MSVAGFLLGARRLASGLFAWVGRNPLVTIVLCQAIAFAFMWHGRDAAREDAARQRAQSAHWYSQFRAQKREMHTLTVRIRDARGEAARLDRENVQRVKREWSHQLQEVSHDYQQDLAAARRTVALRLRGPARPGDSGDARGGGQAGMPALSALPAGTVRPGEAPVDYDGAFSAADIDTCTVNTLRLDHLIRAWNRAAAIDVNGNPTTAAQAPLNGR